MVSPVQRCKSFNCALFRRRSQQEGLPSFQKRCISGTGFQRESRQEIPHELSSFSSADRKTYYFCSMTSILTGGRTYLVSAAESTGAEDSEFTSALRRSIITSQCRCAGPRDRQKRVLELKRPWNNRMSPEIHLCVEQMNNLTEGWRTTRHLLAITTNIVMTWNV